MALIDILTGLSAAIGPAGAEGSAARLAMELLSDYAPSRTDALGSVIAELGDPDAAEHILLDAHIDEIGMIVTTVDDDGFIHVDRCGGADRRTLVGAEVYVLGTRKLSGVVCSVPPHLSAELDGKSPAWDKLYIDIGYPGDQAKKLVPPGSRIVVKSKPYRLLGERVSGKALDNRAGAAVLIRTVELLVSENAPISCRLTVLLSSREEVGGQGAGAAAFTAEPTQAIAVDVSFASQPGVSKEKSGELGKGPMIGFSPCLDHGISNRLAALADELELPWQYEVMGGRTGTNADDISISREGVRCGLVSIPQRNMHSAAEIVDIGDIEATAQLLARYVRTGGVSNA